MESKHIMVFTCSMSLLFGVFWIYSSNMVFFIMMWASSLIGLACLFILRTEPKVSENMEPHNGP